MVQINGSEFVTYDLDTLPSVLDRVASQLKTIPRYLYFPEGIPSFNDFLGDKDIIVEDLLQFVKSFSGSVTELRDTLEDRLTQQNLGLYEDIYLPFVAFNTQVTGAPEAFRGAILLMMQTAVDDAGLFPGKMTVEAIWNEREEIKERIGSEVKATKRRTADQLVLFASFQELSVGVAHTKFELERSTFEFELDMPQTSTLELFNQLHLFPAVPFASANSFFKILKDFVPPAEWDISIESAVFVKVLQKIRLVGAKPADYSDVIMAIDEESPDVVMVSMTLDSGGQYLSRDSLIERFLSAISVPTGTPPIEVQNLRESRVKGPFYYPKRMLERYVFSDMVMNNPLFSSMITIDESDKATKQKDSIYIYFRHPKVGEVHANLTSKVAEKGDPYLRGKDIRDEFKLGTVYTRVKVSVAQSIEAVTLFQEILSKLLVVYDTDYDEVVAFYRQFLPKFPEIKVVAKKPPATLRLKDIAPEVFATDHSSKCSDVPDIISDAEVEARVAQGDLVKCNDPTAGGHGQRKRLKQCYMRYPQTEDEGFIPRNYVCNNPPAVYPGLITNTLANKELVPYLPCCYVSNHDARNGSAYRQYFYGEESTTGETTGQQALLTTNKFAPRNVHGYLPEDILKVFNLFDYQKGYMYVRKGASGTLNSFLDCVMEGMHEETGILAYDTQEARDARLHEVRMGLAKMAFAPVCRQTMYDFSIEEIVKYIANPDLYLSPELFTPLLEHYFNCNIYVFRRTNRSGKLVLPRHTQAYYKNRTRQKAVFIYEHMGSKANNAEYPRCELIVRWQKRGGAGSDDGVTYSAEPGSPVAEGIGQVFSLLRQSYSLNKQIPETVFPIASAGKFVGQGIDSYGKCRMLRLESPDITILTSPVPPFALPVLSGWTAATPEIDTIVDFVARLGIRITGQSVVQGVTKEIFGTLHTVTMSFPVTGGVPIPGVPELDRGVSYPKETGSALDSYNRYKKLARYVVEYSYWLFSRYIRDNPGMQMDLHSLARFISSEVSIDEDFEYGNVPKRFDLASGVMRDGKLMLRSEEALKRLVYTMRLSMRRFGAKILDYHNRTNIGDYYLDITDFDQFNFQVILSGEDSINKWAVEQKSKRYLYSEIQPRSTLPYFFRNELIGHAIFLAQNTDSLPKAVKIIETWLEKGYNPGFDPDGVDDTPGNLPVFTIYSYVNETDVKAYTVAGDATSHDIKIVGYKMESDGEWIAFYTALLGI